MENLRMTSNMTHAGRLQRIKDPAAVIIQNDTNQRNLLVKSLANEEWHPYCVNGLSQARELLNSNNNGIRLIIADINCDDPGLIPVLSELQNTGPNVHYILTATCTNLPSVTSIRRNLKKQNLHLLLKPFYFDEMWQIVRNILQIEINATVH